MPRGYKHNLNDASRATQGRIVMHGKNGDLTLATRGRSDKRKPPLSETIQNAPDPKARKWLGKGSPKKTSETTHEKKPLILVLSDLAMKKLLIICEEIRKELTKPKNEQDMDRLEKLRLLERGYRRILMEHKPYSTIAAANARIVDLRNCKVICTKTGDHDLTI